MYTWLLGIIVFIDDYLNALTVGAAMRKVTDQFGVSREKLAYVVDSTAAPICVLVPISTWAVFYASLFQESGFAEPGQGMDLYISAIPYMIYPIVPCQVRYKKVNKGEITYPWLAERQIGNCEARAEALTAKFTALGWTCETQPESNHDLAEDHSASNP
jgi:hypothetical protein